MLKKVVLTLVGVLPMFLALGGLVSAVNGGGVYDVLIAALLATPAVWCFRAAWGRERVGSGVPGPSSKLWE